MIKSKKEEFYFFFINILSALERMKYIPRVCIRLDNVLLFSFYRFVAVGNIVLIHAIDYFENTYGYDNVIGNDGNVTII